MKVLYILMSSLLLQHTTLTRDCEPALTMDYIDKVEVIAVVSVTTESFQSYGVSSRVVKVFKGEPGLVCTFGEADSSYYFGDPGEYLVYATERSTLEEGVSVFGLINAQGQEELNMLKQISIICRKTLGV